MNLESSPYMGKKFKAYFTCWSLFLAGVIVYNYFRETAEYWRYMLIGDLACCVVLMGTYVISTGICGSCEKIAKGFHLSILALSGPVLLSLSTYGFILKDKVDMEFYALSFLAWWALFSISVYCTFELTLDIAMYYHRKKKAKYYDSIESVSSPLIK